MSVHQASESLRDIILHPRQVHTEGPRLPRPAETSPRSPNLQLLPAGRRGTLLLSCGQKDAENNRNKKITEVEKIPQEEI